MTSPREITVGIAFHVEAFEHGIIHAHVMRRGADGVVGIRIPEHDIGVAANGNLALLGIQAEQFGWSGGNKFHKTV